MENSMKKATLIIWVIIFGFIALVIFQNQPFFLAKESFKINLGIVEEYLSPAIPNAVLILIFFFSGLLISYLFGFSSRFKAKRTIKRLNSSITTHTNEIAKLKGEIDKLKRIEEPVDSHADTIKLDMNTTQQIPAEVTADRDAENKKADQEPDKTLKFGATDETGNPAPDDKEKSDEKKE